MDIDKICKEVVEAYPDKVNNYKLGKKGLIGLFMREVLKLSKGKADPKETQEILKQLLD